MLLNNTKKELKLSLLKQDMTQQMFADKWGKKVQFLAQVISGEVVKKSFIEMWEKLGYDIKIEYVKREE